MSYSKKMRFGSSLMVLSTLLATNTAVIAQDDEEGTIEEVIITATRRGDTALMKTPVAVSAMNTKMIEKFSPRDLNDMAVMVPSLSAGTVSAFKSASFAMRGVSEDTIIVYKESPVGVTIDDFVVPHVQTSNLEMFDIEQVEVLRGPQGTLFGKNTTGGVINVRTKAPVLGLRETDIRLEIGSFKTKKITAAVNVPVNDTIAFRFAGMYLESDGYVRNNYTQRPNQGASAGTVETGDGSYLGGDDVISARAKVLWEPSEDFKAILQYEVIRDRGEMPPIINESGPEYIFSAWGWDAGLQEDPLRRGGITDRDDMVFDLDDGHKIDVDGIYLNTEFPINDDITFYSVTGYRYQESRLANNYTGTVGAVSLFDATRDDNRETFQHEMRIASNSDSAFDWVGGLFFQNNDVDFCVTQYVGFLDFFGLGTPEGYFNNNPLVLCNKQDASAFAMFADGTYSVTEKLHISGGLRYTSETKAWQGRPRVSFAELDGSPDPFNLKELLDAGDFEKYPTGVVSDEETWNELTYRLNVAYDISEDSMVYFGYSRGFKSGGYNDQIGTQLNPITFLAKQPTDPEYADSFELGFKTSFMEKRGALSLTAFDVTYTDAQRTFNASFDGGGQETLFFNAAEMKVQGIEFEGSYMATSNVTLRLAGSWTPKADYVTFEADTDFDGEIDIDLSDKAMTRVPEWKIGADATYTQDISSGSIDYNIRLSHESESIAGYSDVDPIYDSTLQARTLLDASITFNLDDKGLYARIVGRNLTDERYRTGQLSVANLWIMSSYAPPRYFGLEFGLKIGDE